MMNVINTISTNVAINNERRYTERILGAIEHRFYYYDLNCSVQYKVPDNFDLEERILCKLLYQNHLSKEEINIQLGLSQVIWLKDFFQDTLSKLLCEGLIEEDNNIFSLTKQGEEAILNGYKSRMATSNNIQFLYFRELPNIGKDISQFPTSGTRSSFFEDFPYDFVIPNEDNIELFRHLAANQHPEIHCPKTGYTLEECSYSQNNTPQKRFIDLYIFLLHDFTTEKLRAVAYDEESHTILSECSKDITENSALMEKLCRDIMNEQSRQDKIKIGKYKKSQKQLETESQIVSIGKFDDTNFSPLEFEDELQKILTEKHDTIIIYSPWIKRSSLRLLPLFRTFLANEGKLYLCYSETEGSKSDENDFSTIHEIERLRYINDRWPYREYPKNRFILTRDKPFHQKLLFVIDKDSKVAYSGSYNILSFSVNQHATIVRQEDMNKVPWCTRYEQMYQKILAKIKE